MTYLVLKVAISALIIVAVGELAKRSPSVAGATAALPFVSILAMIWLYIDTRNTTAVAELSVSIFWMVLPTLLFFLLLPGLLKKGVSFWPALIASGFVMIVFFGLFARLLRYWGR